MRVIWIGINSIAITWSILIACGIAAAATVTVADSTTAATSNFSLTTISPTPSVLLNSTDSPVVLNGTAVPVPVPDNSSTPVRPQVIKPPRPPVFNCSRYFPGTPEWSSCLKEFHRRVSEYRREIEEYRKKIEAAYNITSDPNMDTYSSSSSYVNGYSIEARGLSISTVSNNNQIKVETQIGKPDKLERFDDEVKKEIHWTLNYTTGLKHQHLTKWIQLTPPNGVNLTSIVHQVHGEVLQITGPDPSGGSGGSGSGGGGGSFNFMSSSSATGGSFAGLPVFPPNFPFQFTN